MKTVTKEQTSSTMVVTDWQGVVNYYQGKNLKVGDLVLHNAKVKLSDNGLSLSFVGVEGNISIMGINVFDVDDVEIIDEMKWVEEIFQGWENHKCKLNELLKTFEGRFVEVTAKSCCDIDIYIENFNYYINDECNTLQYPVTLGNWIKRKNSYHGISEIAEAIETQIALNKQLSMGVKSSMDTAYPTKVYDKNKIPSGISNKVGSAVAVNGDINGAFKFENGGSMDSSALQLPNIIKTGYQDSVNLTDALTGNIRPENTSAIVAVTQNSLMSLNIQKNNLIQFIEDWAKIQLDFMRATYGSGKTIFIKTENGLKPIVIKGDLLKDMIIHTQIDVGASKMWSELTAIETLGNLATQGFIPASVYLRALPKGVIDQKVIDDTIAYETQQAQAKIQAQTTTENTDNIPPETGGISM